MPEPADTEYLRVNLSVGETTLPVDMELPTRPVRLRAVLPVIQEMSNRFVTIGEQNIRDAGKAISCRAGCGACCRQLVPIAEAEAYALEGLIDEMPEPRRSEVRQRFEAANERLEKIRFFERLERAATSEGSDYDAMVREYFVLQIACPFLENETCSIHGDRPIACREYLVTSPAENCSDATGAGVDNVKHFFQVKEALISMSQASESKGLPFVPLIRALRWARENPEAQTERTGREWMQAFFTKLSHYSRPV